MEFAPITTSGYAHPPCEPVSSSAAKPANSKKHHPSLNSTHAGVQMRLTFGHTPVASSKYPEASSASPTAAKCLTFAHGAPGARSQPPAISPRIMVASVGMKLSVAYPPLLCLPCANGSVRGNWLRNQE